MASLTGSYSLAIRRLEKINRGEISTGSMLTDNVMPRSSESVRRRERKELASTFERVSEVTAEQLQRLVTEAEDVLVLLNRLDTTQETLREMIVSEEKILNIERAKQVSLHFFIEILTCYLLQLALYRFQNRERFSFLKDRQAMDLLTEHVTLLEQMNHSRNIARDRVKNTIDHLYHLSEELSRLRDQVTRPVRGVGDDVVPLETHLESLRQGVPELKAFRLQIIQRCAIYHDQRFWIFMIITITITSRRHSYAQSD